MKKRTYFLLVLLLAVFVGLYYYATFPSINIHEVPFWISLIVISFLFACIFMINRIKDNIVKEKSLKNNVKMPLLSKVFMTVTGLGVLFVIFGGLMSSEFFRAKSYASLLKVENRDFNNDIEESSQVTDIALMDTESARIFGDRKIGSLSDVVSQYEVENDYSQISIEKAPMKVSALKYASFFKWWNNRKKGIPGYVKVNPVNSNAEYVELSEGMKYVPSAYLNYNLQRHVQLKYPTKIISGYYFEVDDSGKPYYICPTVSARIGLFGGMDVNGIIMCDPVSGKCDYYGKDNIPSWVDNVYSGYLLTRKYNWFGTLSDGFINSVFGQKNCKKTTDDFGYKIIGNDVYIYTGVTSLSSDAANIGFILVNSRTGEYQYFPVPGAEEYSAMSAAAGAVQQYGYTASFPSLINVKGEPTYIMVLKDASQIVKMYAMVNVRNYNIVVTATSQTEVYSKYIESAGLTDPELTVPDNDETLEAEFTVSQVYFIAENGNTVGYLKCDDGSICSVPFTPQLLRLESGDKIKLYYKNEKDGIYDGVKFEIVSE